MSDELIKGAQILNSKIKEVLGESFVKTLNLRVCNGSKMFLKAVDDLTETYKKLIQFFKSENDLSSLQFFQITLKK